MEERRSALKMLTGTPAGKRSLGKPRRRWKDNIGMDHKEIFINTKNWVNSAQDRYYWKGLVNAALNLRIPQVMELVSICFFVCLTHLQWSFVSSHVQTLDFKNCPTAFPFWVLQSFPAHNFRYFLHIWINFVLV